MASSSTEARETRCCSTMARSPQRIARQGTAHDVGHDIPTLPDIDELALFRWRRYGKGHGSTPSSLGGR